MAKELTPAEKRAKAERWIENRDYRVFETCAEHSQIFDNVKHMNWLVEAVIEEHL